MSIFSEILHDSSLVTKGLQHLNIYKNQLLRFWPTERTIDEKIHSFSKGQTKKDIQLLFIEAVVTNDVEHYSSNDKALILNAAETALNSEIEILGGKVNLAHVDWVSDYKCGYRWTNNYYTRYKTTRFGTDEDVKTVWDLSRCHFLLWLSEAYQLTGEEKYARRVVELISDWIEKNPYCKSINWTCAMEVAIRAINWMYAVRCIQESSAVDDAFLWKLLNCLFKHGCFIYNNLENGSRFSANHYATNLVGLLWLGSLFRKTKDGKRWFSYAMPSCFDEIRMQVLPSGVHFERSISYHRLTCEVFLYSLLAIKKKDPGYKIPMDINYRIQTMVEFVACYTKPNGLAPLFGDNDNGRLLPLIPRDYRDHSEILQVYRSLYHGAIRENSGSCVFVDAGFAVLRNKNYFLMFTNTGVSRYSDIHSGSKKIGTHTHQDALSFELSVGNSDFVIDAGTVCYTASKKLRDEYRSTLKHNTLSIDGKSQFEFGPKDYFSIIGEYTEPESMVYSLNDDLEIVSSSFIWRHAGFNPVNHERRISMDNDMLSVEDNVTSSEAHDYQWNFYLAPDVCIVSDGRGGFIMTGKEGESVQFKCIGDTKVDLCIENDTVSPSYGKVVPTKRIQCKFRSGCCQIKFVFKLIRE